MLKLLRLPGHATTYNRKGFKVYKVYENVVMKSWSVKKELNGRRVNVCSLFIRIVTGFLKKVDFIISMINYG